MGQDSQRELKDLIAVSSFYIGLLEKSLGHPVPAPAAVSNPDQSSEKIASTLEQFRYWLDVLDLAMTPPLVRDSLKAASGYETAHAVLRYHVAKASGRSGDRDKTDCVITYLFRNPPPVNEAPPAWQRPEVDSSYYFVSQAALGFQGDLYRALEGMEYTPRPTNMRRSCMSLNTFTRNLGITGTLIRSWIRAWCSVCANSSSPWASLFIIRMR